MEDADLLLAWRNDPVTRRASFRQQLVNERQHLAWLAETLTDTDRILWIATDGDGNPVGMLRLDIVAHNRAEVSINVAPECRGRGLGGMILAAAEKQAFGPLGLECLDARVRPENLRSQHLFLKSGYRCLADPVRESATDGQARQITFRLRMKSAGLDEAARAISKSISSAS